MDALTAVDQTLYVTFTELGLVYVPPGGADDDEVVRAHGRRLGRPIEGDEHQPDGAAWLPAAGVGVGVWRSGARVRS